MSGQEQKCWIVTGEDGVFGIYATEALAEQHKAAMPYPDEYEIEHDIVRTSLMPIVADWMKS